MQALLGILFHSIGGFASGSFYMPYNKVKKWSWETYWLLGGLFSWLIVPFLAAYLTVPGFFEILRHTSGQLLWIIYFLGLMWGIGGLTYGLGVRYLGMSLGNSVILGVTAAFGAMVPPIYYDIMGTVDKVSFSDMLNSSGGLVVLFGVAVCLTGIALTGRAGLLKEKELSSEQKSASVKEFALVKGLIVAIISGVLSAFFNYGIEAGKPLTDYAIYELGHNPLFVNNVTFLVILWGGLTTNLIWCVYLSIKNNSYPEYVSKKTPLLRNYMFAALAGTTWFLQFFFYGMGESKIGSGASSWILHMSTIILTANMWGIYNKEWKGTSRKTILTISMGIGIILLSVIIVGIGNSMGIK
ncbi:L-rhamnose/proton symporter RhaT [Alkalitalea saponilacus]|uniref:L-rhamnose-H+ transport protein n=1 Tax=Alkalitalea saponilacus TaxID=889453 RepID=A0A1T5EUP9_9BACT|nr:L-rhamnose/proton symporter RhaT [Alkalitalea saponilacus]ASB48031.1 rhamnose/proton symporter RhaT [Alkalitalea saponilacus]SKB87460.1 L-rhamnose-H+ transport protein [Alkalitalea saponilacus]